VEELPRRNLWRWAWVVLAILIVILGILFVRYKTPDKAGTYRARSYCEMRLVLGSGQMRLLRGKR